jgi:hypothetical protein
VRPTRSSDLSGRPNYPERRKDSCERQTSDSTRGDDRRAAGCARRRWEAVLEPPRATTICGAVGSGFTYQGRLTDSGSPANAAYDFQFLLYDTLAGGSQIGATQTIGDLAVTNGLFTTTMDFGATAFDGNARWLEIQVRPGVSTDDTGAAAAADHSRRAPGRRRRRSVPFSAVDSTTRYGFDLQQSGSRKRSRRPGRDGRTRPSPGDEEGARA